MPQPTPVYEWYRYEEVSSVPLSETNGNALTNPPFFPGPAGRLQPYMVNGPILRGFLKRSAVDGKTPTNDVGARGRLYFMFNPTSLSQGWNYDPSTYMFQQTSAADTSVAPAGQAAFNFALFFERSIEVAHNPNHQGVLADVDVLSYITRGVPTNMGNNTLGVGRAPSGAPVIISDASVIADPTGVFIGQGQLIDVIFSKFMTVRGTVSSLQIDYVKFSHRMVPVMCSVNIGMLVTAQSIGTQGVNDASQPQPTANGGGAGTADPGNRYGGSHGTGGGP